MSQGSSLSSTARRRAHRTEPLLTAIVDGGLAAVVLVAPWFMGGRHPLGQLVLVTLAVAIALAWILQQYLAGKKIVWTRTGAELLLLLGAGLVLLQLIPLPQSIFDAL